MIEEMKTAYRFLIVLGLGAVLLLFSIMIPVASSDADFSIYNTGWNGCSQLGVKAYQTGSFLPSVDISASSEESIHHLPLNELELDPSDSAIMIIGPAIDFDKEEASYIDDYMRRGGIVLLADDVGTGNQLLSGLKDTTTRIGGDIIADLSFDKQPEFGVTTNFTDHNITKGINRLLMNYPSTVIPSVRCISLINSSEASWLDINGNDDIDPDESLGPFNIMTIERYGRGSLIVLSEPSLLINQMRNKFNNSVLVDNLIEFMTEDRSTLVIDEYHRDSANPVQITTNFVKRMDFASKIGILVGITALFILISTPYPRRAWKLLERLLNKLLAEEAVKRITKEEVMTTIYKEHPDWDRKVLTKIIDDIEGDI